MAGEKKEKEAYLPPALLHHTRPPPEGESAYGTEFVETADTHLFFQPKTETKWRMRNWMLGKEDN